MTTVGRYKVEFTSLAVLIGAAGCLALAILRPNLRVGALNFDLVALCFLASAAVAVMWLYRRGIMRSMRILSTQLEEISVSDELGHIVVDRTSEMEEIARPLNLSMRQIRQQMVELQQENCKLSIRCRVAESQRDQIEAILRSASDAVLMTNRFHELVFANQSAEEALGFRLSNTMRKNIDEVLADGTLVRLIREALRDGARQPRRVVEHSFGARRVPQTYSITLTTLPGPNDKPTGVVTVLHDITRERDLERGKTEFVANVSHELKTPLSSIKAYTEMLLDGEVSGDEAGQFLRTIGGEAERLHNLIERILNLSRIESGSARVACEPVSMTAVLRQVLQVVSPQAKDKDIKLSEKLAPVYYQVEADYDLLCQAMVNLLNNAIKYTPRGGWVAVQVCVDDRRQVAAIDVRDSGIGISTEDLPCIFEKFYRSPSGSKMSGGTGLGLPLTKYIIEKIHGGKLSVTSEIGKGSTFSFELPLVQ